MFMKKIMDKLEVSLLDENATSSNLLLITSFKQNCLLSFNGQSLYALFISDKNEDKKSNPINGEFEQISAGVEMKVQISLSYIPPHEAKWMQINETGSRLCLSGQRFVAIVFMPENLWLFPAFSFRSMSERYMARCELLDTRLFSMGGGVRRLLEAKWHPGSETDSHLVTLTNDSIIRFYDVSNAENMHQMRRIDLNLAFDNSTVLMSKDAVHFGLINSAVSFDFYSCAAEKNDTRILVLTKDADVYSIDARLEYSVDLDWDRVGRGPLLMSPQSLDNYGCTCGVDLLFLAKSPLPILVLLNENGTLVHCILLYSRKGVDADALCERELYVYESIQLELGLNRIDLNTGRQTAQNCPHQDLRLVMDPTNSCAYFVIWSGGVYSVDVSDWANHLALNNNNNNNNNNYNINNNEQCSELSTENRAKVDYLFCTELSANNDENCEIDYYKNDQSSKYKSVTSVAGIKWPHQRSFIVPDGLTGFAGNCQFFVALTSGHIYPLAPSPIRSLLDRCQPQAIFGSRNNEKSIRKHFSDAEILDEIGRILARGQTMPILDLKENLGEKECAELLLRTMQTLGNRLDNQIRAKRFLTERGKVLRKQRADQKSQLRDFDRRCRLAIDCIECVKAKAAKSRDNFRRITGRFDSVLRQMNYQKGRLSLAEEEQLGQLHRMQENLRKHMRGDIKKISEELAEVNKNLKSVQKATITRDIPRRYVLERSEQNVEKLCDAVKDLESEMKWIDMCLAE